MVLDLLLMFLLPALVVGATLLLCQRQSVIRSLRETEWELRQSQNRMRVVIEQMPAVLWSTDEDLRFTSSLGAGLRELGLEPNEAVGRSLYEYFGTEDPAFPAIASHLRALEGESTSFETEWMGQTFRSYVEPIRAEPGAAIRGTVGVALNVTEQKKTAAALRYSEDQLRQAQKMEAVGRLAAGVAHDFNNLLTAITGYSELGARSAPEDGPLARSFREIRRACDKAVALTRQLLVFSRKQVLELKVLDLNEVVSDVEGILRRVIGEDIELITRPGAEAGCVRSDRGQLTQVILNLAVNARDAMPEGGTLLIETARTDLGEPYVSRHEGVRPGSYAVLAVSDTGMGMDKATQARLFEPFFTTKESGRGTGLGLATVYGIIKQSGGNIWVYSEPGQGATIKIYLPLAGSSEEIEVVEALHGETVSGSECILLVEDDEPVRSLLAEALRMHGYTVLEARNGEEGIRISDMHPGPIQMLVTDVVMPQMSGREMARRIEQFRGDLSVLFMSGYTESAIVEHGLLEDTRNFIQKPFTPEVLARRIREIMKSGAAEPAGALSS
jgi:signal transduction histidine kinase/CheY-like chemotaxis protein